MKKWIVSFFLAVTLGISISPIVAAHPLGNFSVNRYSRIEVGPEEVRLRYVLDLAEIPTLQELRSAGVSAGVPDEDSRHKLIAAKTAELVDGARLTIDGARIRWSVRDASLDFVPGQADLNTMRLELTLVAAIVVADGAGLDYRDANYAGRAGWHEVILLGRDGVSLVGSTVPTQDASDELRAYPTEANRPPLAVSSANARLARRPVVGAAEAPATRGLFRSFQGSTASRAPDGLDPTATHLAGLLRSATDGNALTLVAALLIAAGLGAAHALEPGHGKTIVGGYLIGSRGTARQALLLGAVVTVTHTLGVYALAMITLFAAQYVVPERLYPVLGVASGLTIVAIGLGLVGSRVAAVLPGVRGRSVLAGVIASPHSHEHRDHSHDSHAGAVHSHGGGKPHHHGPPGAVGSRVTLKSLMALGVSGGLVPCPGALVVLLAAVAFQNVILGMLLVVAFSIGLAGVLMGLGLLAVYGGRRLADSPVGLRLTKAGLARALPALSAAAITLAGVVITAQAARSLLS